METIISILNIFLICNLLYAFLFLISHALGDGLAEGISNYTGCFSNLIVLFLLGMTFLIADYFYDKFNWFVARLMLILYISGLVVIMGFLP